MPGIENIACYCCMQMDRNTFVVQQCERSFSMVPALVELIDVCVSHPPAGPVCAQEDALLSGQLAGGFPGRRCGPLSAARPPRSALAPAVCVPKPQPTSPESRLIPLLNLATTSLLLSSCILLLSARALARTYCNP